MATSLQSYAIAKRPTASSCSKYQRVNLMTNYYKFNFSNPDRKSVFKYNVKFTPDIPDNSKKPRNKLMNQLR